MVNLIWWLDRYLIPRVLQIRCNSSLKVFGISCLLSLIKRYSLSGYRQCVFSTIARALSVKGIFLNPVAWFPLIRSSLVMFVDEMEGAKKIRVFVAELANVFRLCDDSEAGFLKRVADGISFCYTEGKNRQWLSEIRKCDKILYYEIQFTEMLA